MLEIVLLVNIYKDIFRFTKNKINHALETTETNRFFDILRNIYKNKIPLAATDC